MKILKVKSNKARPSAISCGMMLLATIASSYSDRAHAAVQATYYVDPAGSDSNLGTQSQPFATLQHARDVVRTVNGSMTGDIYVYLNAGTYYVPSTISFGVADSGTNGYNVYYKNSGAVGSAVFVGGVKVNSSWTQVQATTNTANPDSDMQQTKVGSVYKTNLQAQLNAAFPGGLPATSGPLPTNANGLFGVNTLYINDTRATQARAPNSNKYPGYPSTFFDNPLYTTGGAYASLTYNTGNAADIFSSQLVNAQTRGDMSLQIVTNDIGNGHSWESETLPVTNINTSTGTLTFNPANTGDFAPMYYIGGGSRFYLQGNLAFLDTPGEFYFNRQTYDLYYYPKANETSLGLQNIVVPTTGQVINITGQKTGTWDSTVITPVHNIVFDGLKFEDTVYPDFYSDGWNGTVFPYPDYAKNSSNPSYSGQGESERPQFLSGVMTLAYAQNITITNTNIKNGGMMGVVLGLGTSFNTLNNSLIEYTGHTGVRIEGGFPGIDGNSQGISFTNNNLVDNVVVHDVGQFNLAASAIAVMDATSNTVSHAELYNSPRRGLMVVGNNPQGWDNGYMGDAVTNASFIYSLSRDQYNHDNSFSHLYIHNVQQDGGDDGGIFTAFLYYPRDNYTKPTYFDQIVVDRVAAIPTMSDIAPNNINFDMGFMGIQTSNIKTVNAAHYNIETTIYNITVNNANFDFFGWWDGLFSFDNSKMDLANIGVNAAAFPTVFAGAITSTAVTTPSNVYFSDDFENGLDLTKWSFSGIRPTISKEYMSEGAFQGTAALELNGVGSVKGTLYRNFPNNLNKVVSVDFFDRDAWNLANYISNNQLSGTSASSARADNGTSAGIVSMGIDPSAGGYYFVNVGGTLTATSVRRATGWHNLVFDYTDSTSVKLYIDNNLVRTISGTGLSFNYVSLGSPTSNTYAYFDRVYVYGGASAPPPSALAVPPTPQLPGTIQAVNYNDMWLGGGFTSSDGIPAIGWVQTNNWMDYVVNVTQSGTYTLAYRVATGSGGGQIQLQVNGNTVKTTTLPSTGGYDTWQTVTDTVTLNAGTQTLRVYDSGGSWNFGWFYVGPAITPNTNTIQAEAYSSSSNVVIQSGGSGQVVGFVQNASWMAYVGVDFGKNTTQFIANMSVHPSYAGNQLQLRLDSPTGPLIGTLTTTSTGSWSTFTNQKCAISGVSGVHTLYIVGSAAAGAYVANIDSFTFSHNRPSASHIEAESFDSATGGAASQSGGTGQVVGFIQNGSTMVYNNVDFGSGGNTEFIANISVHPSYAGNQLQLRLDSATGTLIGTLTTASTGDWSTFTNQKAAISGASGVHNLYIVATAPAGAYVANIDWFTFGTASTSTFQAENFDAYNNVLTQSGGSGQIVGFVQNGSWMVYNNVDFGTGKTQFVANMSVHPSYAGNQLQLRLDSPTGTLIGTLTTTNTGDWSTFTNQKAAISGASGVHNLYIVGSAPAGAYIANIDWFTFNTASTSTIQAEGFDSYNNVMIQSGGSGQIVGFIQNASWMAYQNVDFGAGNTQFTANMSVWPTYAGGQLQLRLDSPTGTLIGTLTTTSTGNWTTFTNQTCAVSGVSGVHDLYIVASAAANTYVANIDWLQFQ